jgi:hypothetical protein
MPQFLKHVGQVDATGQKCVVVFRQVPGENNSCLVVETESLPRQYHDDIITAVESEGAQREVDFYPYLSRTSFHDGRNMLEALHLSGWLRKVNTTEVTMLPTREATIKLNLLNDQLDSMKSEGRTTSGDINATPAQDNSPGTLSDTQIANQMRSQAAYFHKEAERLLKEAESLDPTKAVNTSVITETTVDKPKRKYTKKK